MNNNTSSSSRLATDSNSTIGPTGQQVGNSIVDLEKSKKTKKNSRAANQKKINLNLKMGTSSPAREFYKWRSLPNHIRGRAKHTLVSHGRSIYAFGGDDSSQMVNDIIAYDIVTQVWSSVKPSRGVPPVPRYHHTAVVRNGRMYVFGGYTGDTQSNSNFENKNDLFSFDFKTKEWIEIVTAGPRPAPRSAHGSFVWKDYLYVFAGYDGTDRLNDMWRVKLSETVKRWEIVQQQNTPPTNNNFPCALAGDKLYVFSGHSGAQSSNYLFEFHVATGKWFRLRQLHLLNGGDYPPGRRYGHVMVYHNNWLHVFGGTNDGVLPNQLSSYNLLKHQWVLHSPTGETNSPSGRCFLSATMLNNTMYLFGGHDLIQVKSRAMHSISFSPFSPPTCDQDYLEMYEQHVMCDLIAEVGENRREFPLHSTILAARSEYMHKRIIEESKDDINDVVIPNGALLKDKTSQLVQKRGAMFAQGKEKRIRLDDVDGDAFSIAMNFVYSDRIIFNNKDHFDMDLRSETTVLSASTREKEKMCSNNKTLLVLVNVYTLAARLGLHKLKYMIEGLFCSTVSAQNVLFALGVLTLDKRKEAVTQDLKKQCMNIIIDKNNYPSIICTQEFAELEKDLLVDIVRMHQKPFRPIISPAAEPTASWVSPDLMSESENAGPSIEASNFIRQARKRNNNVHHSTGENSSTFLELTDTTESSLCNDLRNFYANSTGKLHHDIILNLSGVYIYAHKFILAARSKYFRGMFESNMIENSTSIVQLSIGDIIPTEDSIHSLLRYMYCGDLIMPPEHSMYLFSTPFFFGFTTDRLQSYCKQNLEQHMSPVNVLEILEASQRIQATEMKNHALEIIVRNFSEVSKLPKLKDLSKATLLDILEAVARNADNCSCGSF